jgi:uncharacterized protein (DUF1778 family)
MARPKIDPTARRTEQINLRLSPVEAARLQEQAELARTSVTAFVRAAAMGQSVTVREAATDFETRQELRRIGVNLNQIAKALNARQQGLPASLIACCEKLDTLFDRMLEDGPQGRQLRP